MRFGTGQLAILLTFVSQVCFGQTTPNFKSPHCGKKFRILTHDHPPFINVDPAKCVNQFCPPDAFGDDGGITYNFMMQDVLRYLKLYCREENEDENVEFDWYLAPTEDKTSAARVVNMLCRGRFDSANDATQGLDAAMPVCRSATQYKGPSPAGSCSMAYGDPTCVDEGPDMVVGAIHILRERLDMLDFTLPFMTESQVVVKRPDPLFTLSPTRLLTIFQPFSEMLWTVIIIEILIVWVLIMLTEAGIMGHLLGTTKAPEAHISRTKRKRKAGESLRNVSIAGGIHAIYDSFFWSMGSAFDPGGPGKSPTTVSGRFIMLAHWFFLVVMAATYTGSVGPFLSDSADLDIIESFDDLKGGRYAVVVRGPPWDSQHPNPEFLGTYAGGNSDERIPPSTQFRLLQTEMKNDYSANFKIYTTINMHSFVGDGRVVITKDQQPCDIEGVRRGAYDMVICKTGDDRTEPDSLIYDASAVVYELNSRKAALGRCDLLTVGEFFNPSGLGIGFPKNTTFPTIFSRAIERARAGGVMDEYKARYRIRDEDNECADNTPSGTIVMSIALLSGLFIITGVVVLIALIMGFVFRVIWPIFCSKLDEAAAAEIAEAEAAQHEDSDDEEQEDPKKKTMALLNNLYEESARVQDSAEHLAESARRAEARAEEMFLQASGEEEEAAGVGESNGNGRADVQGDLVYTQG